MRPLDELQRDAFKRANDNHNFIVISRAELKMLKDYGMVEGTSNRNLAKATDAFGVTIDFIIKDIPE